MSLTGRLSYYLGGAAESEPYGCSNCGAAFDVQYHVCPRCGGFSVERQHWDITE